MRIWDLEPSDEGCADIQVYVPGPPGPPMVDVGTLLAPTVITTVIAAPMNRRQRSFISAASAVNQPTISNPPDNGAWELYLYNAGTMPITLNNASNLKLSGQCILNQDSILYLQWDGNSRYVEGGRNEI